MDKLPERSLGRPFLNDIQREWLLTNGLGGYAAGSIVGIPSRRYHGILVASLPPPYGRTLMLNHLSERILINYNDSLSLSHDEWDQSHDSFEKHANYLQEFKLVGGLPEWIFETPESTLQKTIFMPYRQNTVYITYTVLTSQQPVQLVLTPAFHMRHHESPVDPDFGTIYPILMECGHYEIFDPRSDLKTRLRQYGPHAAFVSHEGRFHDVFYPYEKNRGYASVDRLWSPGSLYWRLNPGETATLVVSTEDWDVVNALSPEKAKQAEVERRHHLLNQAGDPASTFEQELVLASDSFIVTPNYRSKPSTDVSLGNRSIIAGYHWFTDWGRDTMISLEGLTLCTGRPDEASEILRSFAQHVQNGLIPNMFPDGSQEGLYHTADATLWFFQAIQRYLQRTEDYDLLRDLLPCMLNIVEHHIQGTKYGIHVDPQDSLLAQGAPGFQLTWMDAKVGDWVVTPRRGKAVEINALWYNALCLMADWLSKVGRPEAPKIFELSENVRSSFNERFWNSKINGLFDVIDDNAGNDEAIRPNQIFSIALTHEVLDKDKWKSVLDLVTEELLTPVGLRSLARSHPDYKRYYQGDLRARDAAYHQGTVWAWLIGPYIDAYLKVYPSNTKDIQDNLKAFDDHLFDAGIGSISEVFDAEAPFIPRGCPAQAWSVAEVLRCLKKT